MPDKGYLISWIDNLTLLILISISIILLLKKGWQNLLLVFIGINVLYSILMFVVGFRYSMDSREYEVISNLSMHIDTLSGFGFFYFLWNDQRYRKFLIFSLLPVMITWVVTILLKGANRSYYWNLMLPSLWFFVASLYAIWLLYRKSDFSENGKYISKFLFISGFLFYNFIYLLIETCYLFITNIHSITDAWNINYWGYFIFRSLMLAGTLNWFYSRENYSAQLAGFKK